MSPSPSWRRDQVFWAALVVAVALRVIPLLVWGWSGSDCTRDECIYKIVSRPILAGEGLAPAPKHWLPAPGFPYVMAACHTLFGSFEAVKWVHCALTFPLMAVLYSLAGEVAGRGAARWMAWLFAVHPTFVFFAGTMWTEVFYTLLLSSTVLLWLRSRERGPAYSAGAGALLGLCVLFRGVATYLAPIFVLLAWMPTAWWRVEDWRARAMARRHHAAAFLVAMAVVVLPYSVSASARWGGVVVSDATVGHVLSLGNDDYPPATFDYGIGLLNGRLLSNTLSSGRRDCPRSMGPVEHDRCEVDRALGWIRRNPTEFVSRIPTRLAQLYNPHSFLTRHIRWNYWPGLPWWVREGLVWFQVLSTVVIVLGGTVVAWARGRGAFVAVAAGIIGYHMAVISLMYGLTRFRLPLEPFWMVFLAWGLSDPQGVWSALRASRARRTGAWVSVVVLAPLLAAYAWTGFPGLGW